MGKAKKTKVHATKPTPTGLPDASEFDDDSALGPVETMLEQIQSPAVDDQLSGLQLLATLTENTTHVRAIMDTDVIRIVGPFLATPNNPSLRLATAGALRNLSACGVEVCDALFEHDLMTPLLALLSEYHRTEWVPSKAEGTDTRTETYLSAIHLLSNICESCSDALETFNNANLLEGTIRCLDHKTYTLEVSVAVAQLLLIVSEDNASTWRTFIERESVLLALMSLPAEENNDDKDDGDLFATVLLRTLATGIVSNVPALAQQHMAQVMVGLEQPFRHNHRQHLNALSSDIPLVERSKLFETEIINEADPSDDQDQLHMETEELVATQRQREAERGQAVEDQVKNVGFLLEAQRVAAEILTNICTSEEEERRGDMDTGADEAPMSDDDDVAEEVQDFDAEEEEDEGENVTADKLPVEMLEAIRSLNLVEKLWSSAQPIAENVHEILRQYRPTLAKKVKLLRVSCLLCLHNLCNVMSTEDLGGPPSIYKVWLDVGQHIFQGANAKAGDAHLLEASTALMRATLEHLKRSPELFAGMSESDLEMILNGVRQCAEPEIRANWLRILGTLGCLLPEPLVKGILGFLLDSCAQEAEDAWTISEALDALMDMFADKDWPQAAVELGLAQRIRQLDRVLKNKLRQQKRELGERYAAVVTVRTNLLRFAKYVEKEVVPKASR